MKPRTSMKLLAVAFLVLGAAWAQEDEPGRGVARLSLMNGDVSIRRGDSGDWMAGAVNTPLMVRDSVLTGVGSRAEVQFDWANMLRLAPGTEVRLAELENQRYQVELARGTVTLGVLRDSDAEIEVNTPQVSVRPVKRGLYRITVREDGHSEVTVRAGEAEVFTPRGTERLDSGRAMLVRGTASDPEFQMVRAAAEDDWDRWNENRNRDLERSGSYRYVSRHIYGADDLDAYGRWVYDAPYGWVWAPSGVGPGWAPYRYGRWAWIDWYGWSWLSYDPWGWAPYHYGRWYNHARWGWCWWPGSMGYHHYWRPGLVAFFGWGHYSGLHVGMGFGHLGWVPLAPHEPFHPWYGRGYYSGYRNRVNIDNSINIANNVNITNVYRNARVANGVSGIGADEFVRGRAARAVQASEVDFARASVVRGAVPVTPGAESLRFSDRAVQTGSLPRASEPGRFYSRRPATAVERVPFEQQRQGVEQMVSRSLGGAATPRAEAGGAGNLPRTTGERPVTRGESGNLSRGEAGGATRGGVERSESGWRRVGEPARAEPRQEGTGTGRSFGQPVQRPATPEAQPRVERRSEEPVRRGGSAEESWRRFGSPSRQTERSEPVQRQTERSVERPTREAPAREAPSREAPSQERGTVRRQSGERETTRPQPQERGTTRPEPEAGWSRFGSWARPSESNSSPRVSTPRNETPSMSRSYEASPSGNDRRSGAEPRYESPRWSTSRSESARGGESVRINPPIVRERSTPRSESPRFQRSEGPRYESRGSFSRPSAPMGRSGGGETRGGGGSISRGGSGGSMSRSGGGSRGRSR